MPMDNETNALPVSQKKYVYIVKGKNENVALEVDERDVIVNADGDIDCPLDMVLRKNNYTFNHLNEWDAREINFIQIVEGESVTLRSISLTMNL